MLIDQTWKRRDAVCVLGQTRLRSSLLNLCRAVRIPWIYRDANCIRKFALRANQRDLGGYRMLQHSLKPTKGLDSNPRFVSRRLRRIVLRQRPLHSQTCPSSQAYLPQVNTMPSPRKKAPDLRRRLLKEWIGKRDAYLVASSRRSPRLVRSSVAVTLSKAWRSLARSSSL